MKIGRCAGFLVIAILISQAPIHNFISYSQAEKLETGFYLPSRDLEGYRQFTCVKWDREGNCISYHLGVDRKAPEGDPVYAVADGKIEWYSDDVCGFLGFNPDLPGGAMMIKHESTEGTFYALYGHIKNPSKTAGEVKGGEKIAEIGPSYTDPGDNYKITHKECYGSQVKTYSYKNYVPHLHFGIYTGKTAPRTRLGYDSSVGAWRDPIAYLKTHYPKTLIPQQSRTILVIIREEINVESCLRPPRIDPAAETALKQKLIANGFRVVSTPADISVEGEGFGECMGRFDNFWQGRARLEVKVTETSTGRILASEALHAGGIDVTPGAAAKRALHRAGERMGECLIVKLNRGWATPCRSQTVKASRQVGVNDFESNVWISGWNARSGMKEMVEKALSNRGVQVVVPAAADIVVSGAITAYRVIYQINILIFRIGIAYMTVEPQMFNLETAEIERGDEITNFAGGIEILGLRLGFGPQAVAKKISNQIADWVESKAK